MGYFPRLMLENEPTKNPDEPLPKFRLNAKVFQILGVLAVALADREMIDRYLSLSQAERKTIRDVVSAFVLAKAAESMP